MLDGLGEHLEKHKATDFTFYGARCYVISVATVNMYLH
jgi:hypothetical protein